MIIPVVTVKQCMGVFWKIKQWIKAIALRLIVWIAGKDILIINARFTERTVINTGEEAVHLIRANFEEGVVFYNDKGDKIEFSGRDS